METDSYPKFHNEAGAPSWALAGVSSSALATMPPQDHPHVYLNMGNANEIVCPYCASLFRFDPSLGAREAEPVSCGYSDTDFEAWAPQVQTTA